LQQQPYEHRRCLPIAKIKSAKMSSGKMNAVIEDMQRNDWKDVRAIYGEGLATGLAAFTLTPPKWPEWNRDHLPFGRFVARNDTGGVVGWAALSLVPDT
jgi:hypothetical protein